MAEANDTYVCNCGCGLEFVMDKPGLDVFIGERWLITSDSMVEYSWDSYVPTGMHNNWMELKEYIIQKRNEALPRIGDNYRPYIHLYNVNLARYEGNADPIPLNAKLYYEATF